MKKIVIVGLVILAHAMAFGQSSTPASFLGYELGAKFTPHHKVVDYFKSVAAANNNVKLIHYGKSYEGRDLQVAIVSSPENMARIEEIRLNNKALTQYKNSQAKTDQLPAIVWLSYNVHGNEASSTESSMLMLHALANPTEEIKKWLKNTVVIIDPSLNPDGRDRYVNNYNGLVGAKANANPVAREHTEPWPGGRSNHYYFDLNRDWAWQSQVETRQRMKLYLDWMPQLHVDYHEQGINDPYYFAPAAEPIHADVTPWQRNFQEITGKNNAKYFDEKGWQYFTKERFDLLYPAYGDTYPTYNGAIGMTYEQGGSGRAGLAVVTAVGDTLTLKDRLTHHFTTGLATLEAVSLNANKLVVEFKKFFQEPIARKYNSYIIKGLNQDRMEALVKLLKINQIEYGFGGDQTVTAYNYQNKKQETVKVGRNDMVVHLGQSKGTLANVLLEPETFVSDSNTYDITAWALPYAFGLPGFATKEIIKGKHSDAAFAKEQNSQTSEAYAWLLPWNGISDAKLLISLQQKGVKLRLSDRSFTLGGKEFKPGTLLIYKSDNANLLKKQPNLIEQEEVRYGKSFYRASSGMVEKGKDFGSNVYRLLTMPKIAIASGPEVSSLSLGEVWHFLDEELEIPYTMLNASTFNGLDINSINVLLLPSGRYSDTAVEKVTSWVQNGGKLILLEGAIGSFVGKKPFEIAYKVEETAKTDAPQVQYYSDRLKDDHSSSIPGAIFKVTIDSLNPMNYGFDNHYFVLKTDASAYAMLTRGYNAGYLTSENHMSGIAGKNVTKHLLNSMVSGYQFVGGGKVLYYGFNPLFRSMWYSGKSLLVNGLFLVH